MEKIKGKLPPDAAKAECAKMLELLVGVVTTLNDIPHPFAVGKTKVFMKTAAQKELDTFRGKALQKVIALIQRRMRGKLARMKTKAMMELHGQFLQMFSRITKR